MGLIKSFFGLISLVPFLPLIYSTSYYNIYLFQINEVSGFSNLIWYSGVTLAVLSFWFINQRITISWRQLILYILFLPLVYFFISTNNLLVFFMCYEFFLLPSFLIVFFGSPNRRGVLASIYFLMWTQVGSFFVFVSVIIFFIFNKSFHFDYLSSMPYLSYITALLGFGIKIPMWPAHYWLTKTHVEAPTYFSVYLSGFLVKTALYGIWIFSNSFLLINHSWVMILVIIGIIDSSLKMWSQVDLKKLVAYGTVQEMNLILLGFVLGSNSIIKATSLFILAHTILSTIFFLLSDSLYKRFGSRSTLSVRGLLQTTPLFGYMLFTCCLFFAGLPFTLKFIVEVYIFVQLLSINTSILILTLFICNWFGLVSFMKNWFIPLFGSPSIQISYDLSLREILVYSFLCSLLVLISYISYFII